uniref:ceramide synthase 5-like n=1 Tax=Styela clava TaxID=7725 RepID=UPI00193A1DB0|nr:ceramide synthase 5-like [Styela clava]
MERAWDAVWESLGIFKNESHSDDFDNRQDLKQRLHILAYLPIFAIGIFFSRKIYERTVAIPFCKFVMLSDGSERKPASRNPTLETFFLKVSKRPSNDQLDGLVKQTDLSIAFIRTWFRRKRNSNRPTDQKKFCEASWRFLFYTCLFTYGMSTLWESSWFWDNQLCWENFGRQVLDHQTQVYYMLECSFYLSLLFSIMTDIKRKDFFEQLIHHAATLFLIVFSYIVTFVRIGTLVMAIHDISDIFLELGKCFHYIKRRTLADATFVVFAIVFLISRLVIYPFWVIHTSAIKSLEVTRLGFVYYFFNILLVILLCLHIFWASIIIKMACKMIAKGEVEKDDRSDTEEDDTDDESTEEKKYI